MKHETIKQLPQPIYRVDQYRSRVKPKYKNTEHMIHAGAWNKVKKLCEKKLDNQKHKMYVFRKMMKTARDDQQMKDLVDNVFAKDIHSSSISLAIAINKKKHTWNEKKKKLMDFICHF